MTSNGYSEDELVDGPENGWFGYNSLVEQDIKIDDFESFISNNSPVWFTSKKVIQQHHQFGQDTNVKL